MSGGLMRSNRRQTRKVVLSNGCGQRWDLTESRSSMTRWGLDAEDGLVPLSLLNCVTKMFMVARSTSERLCLICRERHNEVRRKCPALGSKTSWGSGDPCSRKAGPRHIPTVPAGVLHTHQEGADGTGTSSVKAKPRQRCSEGQIGHSSALF